MEVGQRALGGELAIGVHGDACADLFVFRECFNALGLLCNDYTPVGLLALKSSWCTTSQAQDEGELFLGSRERSVSISDTLGILFLRGGWMEG